MKPWARFARCGNCGVDAGLACRDDDDIAKTIPCRGRSIDIDVLPRCFWCGDEVPQMGRGPNVKVCCKNVICQRVRNNQYKRAARRTKQTEKT